MLLLGYCNYCPLVQQGFDLFPQYILLLFNRGIFLGSKTLQGCLRNLQAWPYHMVDKGCFILWVCTYRNLNNLAPMWQVWAGGLSKIFLGLLSQGRGRPLQFEACSWNSFVCLLPFIVNDFLSFLHEVEIHPSSLHVCNIFPLLLLWLFCHIILKQSLSDLLDEGLDQDKVKSVILALLIGNCVRCRRFADFWIYLCGMRQFRWQGAWGGQDWSSWRLHSCHKCF